MVGNYIPYKTMNIINNLCPKPYAVFANLLIKQANDSSKI